MDVHGINIKRFRAPGDHGVAIKLSAYEARQILLEIGNPEAGWNGALWVDFCNGWHYLRKNGRHIRGNKEWWVKHTGIVSVRTTMPEHLADAMAAARDAGVIPPRWPEQWMKRRSEVLKTTETSELEALLKTETVEPVRKAIRKQLGEVA